MKKFKADLHEIKTLKFIARYGFIPVENKIILCRFAELNPKWKYEKSIKGLKAQGYIKAVAVDCSNLYNRKDTLTLTKKGFYLCQKLGIEINPHWKTMQRSPSFWRHRAIADIFFSGSKNYINSAVINDLAKGESSLPIRGTAAVGYIKTQPKSISFLPVYYVNGFIPSIMPQKEKIAKHTAEQAFGTGADYFKFDKMILFENEQTMKIALKNENLKKIKPGSKIKPLFAADENIFVYGRTYAMFDSLLPKGIPKLALYFVKIDTLIESALEKDMIKKRGKTNFKTYPSSSYENDEIVVFSIPFYELHKLFELQKAIDSENENRRIIAATSQFTHDIENIITRAFSAEQILDEKIEICLTLFGVKSSE